VLSRKRFFTFASWAICFLIFSSAFIPVAGADEFSDYLKAEEENSSATAGYYVSILNYVHRKFSKNGFTQKPSAREGDIPFPFLDIYLDAKYDKYSVDQNRYYSHPHTQLASNIRMSFLFWKTYEEAFRSARKAYLKLNSPQGRIFFQSQITETFRDLLWQDYYGFLARTHFELKNFDLAKLGEVQLRGVDLLKDLKTAVDLYRLGSEGSEKYAAQATKWIRAKLSGQKFRDQYSEVLGQDYLFSVTQTVLELDRIFSGFEEMSHSEVRQPSLGCFSKTILERMFAKSDREFAFKERVKKGSLSHREVVLYSTDENIWSSTIPEYSVEFNRVLQDLVFRTVQQFEEVLPRLQSKAPRESKVSEKKKGLKKSEGKSQPNSNSTKMELEASTEPSITPLAVYSASETDTGLNILSEVEISPEESTAVAFTETTDESKEDWLSQETIQTTPGSSKTLNKKKTSKNVKLKTEIVTIPTEILPRIRLSGDACEIYSAAGLLRKKGKSPSQFKRRSFEEFLRQLGTLDSLKPTGHGSQYEYLLPSPSSKNLRKYKIHLPHNGGDPFPLKTLRVFFRSALEKAELFPDLFDFSDCSLF
jgi:hypothetical protein